MGKVTVPVMTGDEYRAQAKAEHLRAEESFQRCDTDGFVSQWASGMMSRHDARLAELADDGGLAEFPALFTLDGQLAPAKLITTQYGTKWALFSSMEQALKPRGGQIIAWLTMPMLDSSRSVKSLASKGFRQGTIKTKAGVTLAGGGRGLAGATSVYVAVVRLDDGFDPEAEVIWDGSPD